MSENLHTLDASGLNCPLPILRTRKAISGLASGDVLEITATDPGSVKDLASFCNQTGNELLSHSEQDGKFIFQVRKA